MPISRRRKSAALLSWCLLVVMAPAYSQAPSAQPSEADRLTSVRELVSQARNRKLVVPDPKQSPREAAVCNQMLEDLLHGKGFTPVEPVAILPHPYPVQNEDRPMEERDEALLPEPERNESRSAGRILGALKEPLQRCADAEANGDEQRARALFNAFDEFAGAPPFRVYLLPEGVNPFPSAGMAYWSEYSAKLSSGRAGYQWVDLDKCERVGSIPVFTDSTLLASDPQGQRAALTIYEGRAMAWSTERPGGVFAHGAPKPPSAPPLFCYWSAAFPHSPAP